MEESLDYQFLYFKLVHDFDLDAKYWQCELKFDLNLLDSHLVAFLMLVYV